MSEAKQMELVRRADGTVEKGCLNPKGENGYSKLRSILQAIKYKGKSKGTGFERHIADRFYINDAVLMAVLKKAVPEMQRIEHSGEIKGAENRIIVIYANKPAEVNTNTESRFPTA